MMGGGGMTCKAGQKYILNIGGRDYCIEPLGCGDEDCGRGMEMEGGPREITGMLFGDESSPPPPFLCQQSLWCSWVVCRHLVSLWHRQADRQETG